jgi:hypothetical protein
MKYFTVTIKTNQTANLYYNKNTSLDFDEKRQVAISEELLAKLNVEVIKKHLLYKAKKYPTIFDIADQDNLEVTFEAHEADLAIYTLPIKTQYGIYYLRPSKNQSMIDKLNEEIESLQRELDDAEYELEEAQREVDNLEFSIREIKEKIASLEVQS